MSLLRRFAQRSTTVTSPTAPLGRLSAAASASRSFSSAPARGQIWTDASAAQVQERLGSSHPAADKLVLLDFAAEWCGPCRILSPTLESLVNKPGTEADLLVVDVDREPSLAQKYGVRAMPTVVAVRNGQEVSRFVGLQPEAKIVAFIKDASN
ncbi:hypothetical protein V8E36_002077 [Tilletia maclaganii]